MSAKRRGLNLGQKIVIGFVLSGFIAAVATAIGAYVISSRIVAHDVEIQLKTQTDAEWASVQKFFAEIDNDLKYLAASGFIQTSLAELSATYNESAARRTYIDNNPHPAGQRQQLQKGAAETPYDIEHGQVHSLLAPLLEQKGLYDIFLTDADGNLVYTVLKENDFATNLVSGTYSDSGLGRAIRGAMQTGGIFFADFAPYAPSNGVPAAFQAYPIEQGGKIIGTVAIQLPDDLLSAAVQLESEGLTYIAGGDGLLRVQLAQTDVNDVLKTTISQDWIDRVRAAGGFIELESDGLLGTHSMITIEQHDVYGAEWFIVSETPTEVALAPLRQLEIGVPLVVLPVIVLIAGVAFFVGGALSRAIGGLSSMMGRVSDGRLDNTIPGLDRSDEIGGMARALETFQNQARVQLAVTAALDSNKTATLLVDGKYQKIKENASFEALWSRHASKLSGLNRMDDDGVVNFAPFFDLIENAGRSGAEVKTKINGDQAMDIEHNGLIFEVKRAPVVDQFGETVGTSLEVNDVSIVRKIERELIEVAAAAEEGIFSKRVTKADGLGFTSIAAVSLNQLMESVENFMGSLENALKALADGDLTNRLQGSFSGRFAVARDRFNTSIEEVCGAVVKVNHAATHINQVAGPIASGSKDLASRAEQQASTLEETAATMEEMAATIKENAGNSEKATELSARARDLAEDGGKVVAETVTAMSRIEESSEKISEIISVIEGIAFQTNLLALNAAVEAARAGELGKGFAVVASEVRTLAQRSSEAAQDIKGLIETSSSQVADGVSLVSRTGESLTELVDSIRSVAATIAEISNASREQASGVEEITQSVNQLDEMTQRNSNLAVQSASSATDLQTSVNDLGVAIAQFTVEEDTTPHSGASAAA